MLTFFVYYLGSERTMYMSMDVLMIASIAVYSWQHLQILRTNPRIPLERHEYQGRHL